MWELQKYTVHTQIYSKLSLYDAKYEFNVVRTQYSQQLATNQYLEESYEFLANYVDEWFIFMLQP